MFEPTETESVQTLEALAQALERIAQRAQDDPESLHRAPRSRGSRGLTKRAPPTPDRHGRRRTLIRTAATILH